MERHFSLNPDPARPALHRYSMVWREAQVDLQDALDQHLYKECGAQLEEKIRRIKRAYIKLENAHEDFKRFCF